MEDYTRDELLGLIKYMAIGDDILSEYDNQLRLDKLKLTKYYIPSLVLTEKLNKGIEIELDENLLYLDGDNYYLTSFINNPNFGKILKFISTNSLPKLSIDYFDYFESALESKNYETMVDIYNNFDIKEQVLEVYGSDIRVLKYISSIKIDWAYLNVLSDNFIYAYYKIRPEEFSIDIMHKILQVNYSLQRNVRVNKLRKLFLKLINPKDNYCDVCYIKCDNNLCKHCIKIKTIPIKKYIRIPNKLCQNCNSVPIKIVDKCKLCDIFVIKGDILCNKCNSIHLSWRKYCNICKRCGEDHKHCQDCSERIDIYDNCACL
jgi:hypothetical protein